jgi:hypothetical protein
MACPFFMPVEKLENGAWPHPARLPLGCGWSGHCTAPGHEGEVPSTQELHECNLGYALGCGRLPKERAWDAVRFFVMGAGEIANRKGDESTDAVGLAMQKSSIQFRYVCERDYLPIEHGSVEFEMKSKQWARRHADARVQRMAECCLESYLAKCGRSETGPVAS